tara:strand:+ start:5420 stop:5719 length:300 start_codon:yes stop_codon:yes gene_type:complete
MYTIDYQGYTMDVDLDCHGDIESIILYPQEIEIIELMDGKSKDLLKELGEEFDWMFNDLSDGELWNKIHKAIEDERMDGEMSQQISYYESRGHDMSQYY